MSKYANLTIQLQITGQGRPLRITRSPLSPTNLATTSPPGALNVNTVGQVQKLVLQVGNNTVTTPAQYLTGYTNPYYFIFSPPSSSTNVKALLGSNTDAGVYMVPNLPWVLAFPAGTPPTIIIYSANVETCDAIFI